MRFDESVRNTSANIVSVSLQYTHQRLMTLKSSRHGQAAMESPPTKSPRRLHTAFLPATQLALSPL